MEEDITRIFIRKSLLVLLLLGAILGAHGITEEEEARKNSVEVQFYRLTESEWNSKAEDFKEVISSRVTEECKKDPVKCGLTQWQNSLYDFAPSNVIISSTSDEKKNYLTIKFHVKFYSGVPSGDRNLTDYVLNKNALTDAVTLAKDDLNEAMDKYIVDINGVTYYPPPNRLHNLILVPLAFVLLLVVIIGAAICFCYSRKQKKASKREQRKDVESPKSKVGPAPEQNGPNQHSKNGKERPGPIKKKPSPNYFRDEEGVAYGVYDGCEIAEIMMRGNVLPPLTDEYEETDGEMKRHKKKKKGKKSKRDKSRDKSDVEAGSAQDEEKDKDVRNVGSSLDDLNHTVTEM